MPFWSTGHGLLASRSNQPLFYGSWSPPLQCFISAHPFLVSKNLDVLWSPLLNLMYLLIYPMNSLPLFTFINSHLVHFPPSMHWVESDQTSKCISFSAHLYCTLAVYSKCMSEHLTSSVQCEKWVEICHLFVIIPSPSYTCGPKE